MRSTVLAFLVLLLALAGCVGSGPSATTSTLDSGKLADEATGIEVAQDVPLDAAEVPAPLWSVGDAWTGMSKNGEQTRPITLVVTMAEGDFYTVETTDPKTAGWDAMFDVSYVGRIRARDLAGSQQDQPVQFYDFPLADGKSWTTIWDGLEVALTATKSARGFDIVGTVDGAEYVRLDYVHDLRWFSKLEFAEGYGITLERVESGWTGEIVAASAKIVYEGHPAAPVGSPGAGAFTMDEGQAFGMLTVTGGGSQWARLLYLVQPNGQPYLTTSTTNAEAEGMGPRQVFLYEMLPAMAGAWEIAAPSVHDPTGAFHVAVRQVAITPKQFP